MRVSEVEKRLGQVVEGASVGEPDRDTAEQDQHRQRGDEGVQPEVNDQHSVEGTDTKPDKEQHDDREERIQHQPRAVQRCVKYKPRRHHRRDTHNRFQREVKPSDDQDDRFRQHQDRQFRRLLQDVDQVDPRQERRMKECAGDKRDDDELNERHLVAEAKSERPSRARRPASVWISARPSYCPTPSIAATISRSCHGSIELPNDPSSEHDEHAIAYRELVGLVGDKQHRRVGPLDGLEQRLLCRDIDAGGGMSQHQHARIGSKRASHDGLLLITARQLTGVLRRVAHLDLQLRDNGIGERSAAIVRNDAAEPAQPVQHRERNVFLHREIGAEAAGVAILRYVRNTAFACVVDATRLQRATVYNDPPRAARAVPQSPA